MTLEKGQRMPNASDFSRWVDSAGERESKYFICRGRMTGLSEFNSRIIAGERLAVCALIA